MASSISPQDIKQKELGSPNFPRTKRVDPEERRARVLDEKTRTIGVDVDALNAQIDEKQRIRDAEKAAEARYASEAILVDKTCRVLDTEHRTMRKQMLKEELDWNASTLAKSASREYDLNDPDALKKSLPARTGDADIDHLGPSSMQVFAGEDLDSAMRRKLQVKEQATWVEQQRAEREAALAAEKAERELAAATARMQAAVGSDIAAQEAAIRAEIARKLLQENKEKAEAARQKKILDKAAEIQADEQEKMATLRSDMITENPGVGLSASNPMRLRPDHYKGMSPEQIEAVRREQAAQAEYARMKKELEKAEEAEYARQQDMIRKGGMLAQQEVDRIRREEAATLKETLKQQSAEKKERDTMMNTTVYTNVPQESFFQQFGKSHR
eukprot:jgi/Mesvir1/7092/Mv09200-RA.1